MLICLIVWPPLVEGEYFFCRRQTACSLMEYICRCSMSWSGDIGKVTLSSYLVVDSNYEYGIGWRLNHWPL